MAILVIRAVLAAEFLWVLGYGARDIYMRKRGELRGRERYAAGAAIGFVTDLLDTLGIGSFAPSLFAFKALHALPKDAAGRDRDDLAPGTLNVGHALPVIVEALLFLDFVTIEPVTLVGLLAAACLGGVLGARWVSSWPVNTVRLALGVCLLLTAGIVLLKQFGIGPYAGANEALLGLRGWKLIVALAVNFFLGVLMNLGFGLYAPCMGLLLALGMDVGAIFPIMMGSTALQMPLSATVFIRQGKYDPKLAVMLAGFGTLGVLAAYFLVKSLDLTVLLYIVVAVMLYTAAMYLRDGLREMKAN